MNRDLKETAEKLAICPAQAVEIEKALKIAWAQGAASMQEILSLRMREKAPRHMFADDPPPLPIGGILGRF